MHLMVGLAVPAHATGRIWCTSRTRSGLAQKAEVCEHLQLTRVSFFFLFGTIQASVSRLQTQHLEKKYYTRGRRQMPMIYV